MFMVFTRVNHRMDLKDQRLELCSRIPNPRTYRSGMNAVPGEPSRDRVTSVLALPRQQHGGDPELEQPPLACGATAVVHGPRGRTTGQPPIAPVRQVPDLLPVGEGETVSRRSDLSLHPAVETAGFALAGPPGPERASSMQKLAV
ncbi:hypothetical protein LX36DRAFT_423597 [Colletotrichum falcatum]|nr:hypothetical protein LX36DRAFT_423597 [Colletotrichum falcatum]